MSDLLWEMRDDPNTLQGVIEVTTYVFATWPALEGTRSVTVFFNRTEQVDGAQKNRWR